MAIFSRFSLDDKITLIDEIITIKRECNHYSWNENL